MAKRLKEQNIPRLLAVAIANLALFFLMLNADTISAGEFNQALKNIGTILSAALSVGLLTLANGILSAQMKARLVFLRWKDPLPACRAFTEHAENDPRIDIEALKRFVGEFPTEPRNQNTTWYRFYKSVESHDAVAHNHKDFLFTRDYTSLSVLFLVMLGGLAIVQFDEIRQALPYIAFLVGQYLLVRHVAVRYGNRFVTTVLATKAAEG